MCRNPFRRLRLLQIPHAYTDQFRVINELPSTPTRMVVGKAKEPLLLQTFWDNLPDEFEAKDFKAIAQSIGLTIPTSKRYIRAWIGTRLEKVARGKYIKV